MNYTLPAPEDKEGQKIILKTFEKGKSALPVFVKFDADTRTYMITTSEKTKSKTYFIDVSLSDSYARDKIFSFIIDVGSINDYTSPIIVSQNS